MPHADNLIVDESKVVDYLLNPVKSRGKAGFFLRLGFRAENWQQLAAALEAQAKSHLVVEKVDSPFGTRYIVDGAMVSPDGRTPLVRTVWIIEAASIATRLVTAYPL